MLVHVYAIRITCQWDEWSRYSFVKDSVVSFYKVIESEKNFKEEYKGDKANV